MTRDGRIALASALFALSVVWVMVAAMLPAVAAFTAGALYLPAVLRLGFTRHRDQR